MFDSFSLKSSGSILLVPYAQRRGVSVPPLGLIRVLFLVYYIRYVEVYPNGHDIFPRQVLHLA